MGSGIDFAEDRQERARQRKLAAQKAQAEWEKSAYFTNEGYLNKPNTTGGRLKAQVRMLAKPGFISHQVN